MLSNEQFPAYCAHRGLSGLLPENSMAAFGAAYGLGADELELDIRLTRDHQLVVSHDPHIQRVSQGTGFIADYTLDELKRMPMGKGNECAAFFATPEEVFKKFGGSIVMNLHLKECGESSRLIHQLKELICAYHLEDSVYFAGSPDVLEQMQRHAPDIHRCAIQLPRDTLPIMEMAERFSCFRVQFWLGMFDRELIDALHARGIKCNLYYADKPEDIKNYLAMGIDVILTNRMDIASSIKGETI